MVPHQAVMAAEETAGPPGLKTLHLPIEEEEEPAMPMQEVLCKGSDSFNTHSLRSEKPFCRICHEGEVAEALLSPCNCAGTLATVHRGCLECWLATSNTNCCELCHFQFAVERLPKPLSEWLETPSAQHQRRTLCGDAMCFSFITPLASLSGWLCIQGAMDLYYSNSLEAIGLIVLTFTLFSIYLFWTTVSLRYHLHLFKAWRRTNQRVMLLVHRPEVLPCSHPILSQHLSNTDTGKETMV